MSDYKLFLDDGIFSIQDGKYTEAIDLIKRNSRRYAKRQYTFFNHQLDIKWFETDYDNFINTITEQQENFNEKTITSAGWYKELAREDNEEKVELHKRYLIHL